MGNDVCGDLCIRRVAYSYVGSDSLIHISGTMMNRPIGFVQLLLVASFVCLFSVATTQAQQPKKETLIRTLKTGIESSKQRALDQLVTLGDDPMVLEVLLTVLKKDSRTSSNDSKLRMLQMVGKHSDNAEVVSVLESHLEARNHKLVMVAVDSLAKVGSIASLSKIEALVKHPSYDDVYGFRKCIIQAVLQLRDKRSIVFAVKQLEGLSGQLEFDIARYLHHISLQPFADNAEKWKTWFRDNYPDFNFEENSEPYSLSGKPPEDFKWPKDTAEFFGIYIYAKRLLFVVDTSSSMTSNVGGQTRLALAKRELVKAIKGLPSDVHFGIVAYNTKVTTWGRELKEANINNREAAVKWVEKLAMGKGTASYDALDRAMDVDGNTEAIFFLSDGAPSKGRITDKNEIVATLTKKNFFRRIAFYTIGIGIGGGETEAMMRQLAEKNSGAYEPVNQ